jgi:hypothetical protein
MYLKAKTTRSASPTPPQARQGRVQVKKKPRPSIAPTQLPPPPLLVSSHRILHHYSDTRTMLASPFHYQQQQPPNYHHQTLEFLPKIPSPLSPRSANINGSASSSNRTPQQPNSMNSENSDASTQQKPQSGFTFNAPAPLPYSKRAIKRAPAVSQDALTERRRGMFLKKVREGREDRRFERHGEDVSIASSLNG